MKLDQHHIASKEIIGHLDGHDVVHLTTTGGFQLLVLSKGGSSEVLAGASHIGIAKHIAKKKFPDIQFTDLYKSEEVPGNRYVESIIEKYEKLTDEIRKFQKLS